MSIETLLAKLTEGCSWRVERSDGSIIEIPAQRVAGTLGIVAREIDKRKSRRSAGVPTEFGLNLLVARCTDAPFAVKLASAKAAHIAWGLFWDEDGNGSARIKKDTFMLLGRVAVDDHSHPSRYHRISDRAMADEIKVDHKTYARNFKTLYGSLKAELSRIEYPVVQAFWRAY